MSNITNGTGAPVAVDYDPFAEGAIARVVPTTEPQREIWLADLLGRDASLAFNESVSLRLAGRLDGNALRGALQELLDRHSALRANVGPEGDTLSVLESVTLALETRDLAALAPEERERAIHARRRAAVETPFALQNDRLFRAELLRIEADDHLLILTAHHVICDGWSWGVLVRELGALYARHAGHAAHPLPPAEDFAAYALEQAERATDPAELGYWVSRFDASRFEGGALPVLDLPTDRPRPARRTFASAREDYVLDAGLVAAVRKTGARRGASLFATLLATFAAVLARLSNQSQVVVGIPVAGQSLDGHERLVGHCVNTLPLLFELDLAQPAAKAIDDAKSTLLDALDHQRITFGTLLKKLKVPRDPSRLPLISVSFNIDQALDGGDLAFPGLKVDFSSNPRASENFELFVNAVQEHGGLRLECQFNTDLFDAATVRQWMGHWRTLLAALVAGDAADAVALGGLPLLADDERRKVLETWNDTRVDFPAGGCVHELFEAQVAATPDAPALQFDGRRLAFAELNARANRLAHHLRAAGVKPDDRVAMCVERGVEMVVALLAVLKAGGAYVPLDPVYPAERLKFMVDDCAPRLLLVQRRVASRLDVAGIAGGVPVIEIDEAGKAWSQRPDTNPDRGGLAPSHLAYVIYTSGSTGKPKGVMLEHAGVCNYLAWAMGTYRPSKGAVVSSSFAFDATVTSLFTPLLSGGMVRMLPEKQEIDGLLTELTDPAGCGLVKITPAHLEVMGQRLQGAAGRTHVDVFVVGGEALPASTVRLWRGLQPGVRMVNEYGPTETVVGCCVFDIPHDQPADGPVSIGRPIANMRMYILDAFGQPVPAGVVGEIHIGGASVARGYLNRPELTAERFLPDPFSAKPGARMYRTGDLGRWRADGNIDYLGRNDFQVKVRGYRVELGEIEKTLASHPSLSRAVVITREDRPGDVRLVGYVVPAAANASPDPAALSAHLKATLPEYMVPQHFVVLESIPLTPNGKVDRKALPAPDLGAARSREYVAPRDELERAVAAEMESALGMPGVSIDDDFFALGGHSLLAAQLTARLNRALDTRLTMRSVFAAPTIARLAQAIAAERAAPARPERKPLVALKGRREAPLTVMQERNWFLEELHPGRPTYNGPSAHRITGALNQAAFERAFREMVRRQPALRTRFEARGPEVVQVVEDAVEVKLFPAEDLSGFGAQREAQLARRLEEFVVQPFDLTKAPLWRAHVFRMSELEHVVFFMIHHIVWDGWSFDLFYQEMAALYAAYCEGKPSPLPELEFTYGDFAAWHREWMQGPEFAEQLAFWRSRLERMGEARELPTDHPRRPGMSGVGRTRWISVDRPRVDALHAIGRAAGATMFITTLAAYCALLHGYSGQRSLMVGTPVRRRNAVELEPIMGYFNNLVPLHLEVDPAEPFTAFMGRVKGEAVDSFAHPDVPLEQLASELTVTRGAGGSLLYQALFSFQDARARVQHWGGLTHGRVEVFQPGATEDLGLWFMETNEGLAGGATYNAELLSDETAAELQRGYVALLDAIIAAPEAPVGKLLEAARVARSRNAQSAAPATAAAKVAKAGTPPSTPTEKLLAEIWCRQLKVPSVSSEDNFFDLGGHSLLAMQAILEMEQKTGGRIDRNKYIFESLAQIARGYDEASAAAPAAAKGGLRGLFSGLLGGKKTP